MEQQLTQSDELIKKAKTSEQEGQATFMDPQVKPLKKPKGRPRKESLSEDNKKQQEPQKQQDTPKFNIPTKVLCIPIVKGISAFGVNYTKNPKAAMMQDEIEGMSEAMGMVIDKYLPDAMGKYGPEIVLGVTLSQYGLRLYALKKVMEHDAGLKKATTSQTNASRPESSETTTTGIDHLVMHSENMAL